MAVNRYKMQRAIQDEIQVSQYWLPVVKMKIHICYAFNVSQYIYMPVTAPDTNVNTDVLAAAVLHINTTDVCRCVLCSEYLCVWLNKCNIIIQMANINF